MATREQLLEANKKSVKSPRTGKRGKSWKTIAQEKVREEYENRLREEFGDIFEVHIKAAKNPENAKERMYAIDQFVGKAKERIDLNGSMDFTYDEET